MYLKRTHRNSIKTLQSISETARNGHKEPSKPRPHEHVPMTRFGTCQWLYGEPKDREFCNHPVKLASSYCEHHHSICYIKQKPLTEAGEP